MELARAILILVRPRASLVGVALCGLGWQQNDRPVDLGQMVMACTSAGCVLFFAMVFNDIRDAPLDAVAKPSRPIPSGRVTLAQARRLACVLVVASLAAATLVSVWTVSLAATGLVSAWLYSVTMKNTVLVGNLVVAAVCGSVVAYAAAGPEDLSQPCLFTIGFAFVFILENELYKTLLDRDSDMTFGLHTTATALSPRMMGALIFAVSLALTVLTFIAMYERLLATTAERTLAVASVAGALAAACLVFQDPTRQHHAFKIWTFVWLPGVVLMSSL